MDLTCILMIIFGSIIIIGGITYVVLDIKKSIDNPDDYFGDPP